MQRYPKAYSSYLKLRDVAQLDDNKAAASVGLVRSAFKAREFEDALAAAQSVRSARGSSDDLRREADYVRAKSCLGMSRRAEAYGIFE